MTWRPEEDTPMPLAPAAPLAAWADRTPPWAFCQQTLAVAEAEIKKLRHDPLELLTRAVQPTLWLLIFGEVFTRVRAIPTGDLTYIEFMAPGTFVQAIMFVSIIAGGVQLVVDKERGIIEGYLVTPLKKYEIVVGVLLSGVFKALFSSAMLFLLAIVLAGIRPMNIFPHPNPAGIVLTMVTLFLTSLGLIAMMTAYAVRSSSADLYRVTCFPINLLLYYTSGAIYPLNGMPAWMQQVSVINPETYAVHALRLLMYKGAGIQAVAGDFAFLLVFTGLMLMLAIAAFRRAI
jgi:ABC-2 type transport system permease protein